MFGRLIPDRNRSGEFFGFFDIFGKFSSILGPEQVDAINKAAGPYGILSVILIIIAGALLYFFVLPRTLKGDQRKI